jgi:ABC-2 type transport system permease protein
MLYMAVVLTIVLAAGLISGWAFFGIKPMLIPTEVVSIGHALWLIALAYLLALALLSCVVSLAMLFSAFIDSSLTAAIVPMVLVLVIFLLTQLSFFKSLQPYWFMNHFDAWYGLLQAPIKTKPITDGLLCFAAWSTGAMALAWLIFRRRDILS